MIGLTLRSSKTWPSGIAREQPLLIAFATVDGNRCVYEELVKDADDEATVAGFVARASAKFESLSSASATTKEPT